MAHGIGCVDMEGKLEHVDSAVFCTYKYLCAGPGTLGGLYIHPKFNDKANVLIDPGLKGWFGLARNKLLLQKPMF